MYYKLLYEYRKEETFKRFSSFDELLEYLNILVKTGKLDSGTIYITTII